MTTYNDDYDIRGCDRHEPEDAHNGSYVDWKGNAALEKDFSSNVGDLHETVGLDPQRWSIVGMNISPVTGKRMNKTDRKPSRMSLGSTRSIRRKSPRNSNAPAAWSTKAP